MQDPYLEPTEEPLAASSPLAKELSEQGVKEQIVALEKEKTAETAAKIEQLAAPAGQVTLVSGGVQPAVISVAQEAQKLKSYEKNQQLKALVDLAFQKGVIYAADVARNLDNPYLMDEFHDTLVDELHNELVQKGKLEEI